MLAELHEGYVDDTNLVAEQTPVGARYDGECIRITAGAINEDEGSKKYETLMIKKLWNSCKQ